MPKVSVILTSFNHEKYINEAIDSILNQTFTDYQLIIWDDASSDNSWQLIQNYTDPRIKTFRNDNNRRGIYGINKAISEIASGDYIAINHSDDVWELDKLQKQVGFLDNNPEYGAVFTWAQIIDENGIELENNWFLEENKSRWQWLNQLFLGYNHLNHPSVLIRKQCYQAVGYYNRFLAQIGDAEMWTRVLIKYPIHIIQEKLTKHRLFSDNSNTSGNRADVNVRVFNEWNVLRENYLKLTDFENIIAIFPNLERYRNSKGFDNKFLMAMACLYECEQRNAWQLGLKWSLEGLNDETRYKKIKELYSFSYKDFIALTAEFDVYATCSLAKYKTQINELNAEKTELNLQVTELNLQVTELNLQVTELSAQIIRSTELINALQNTKTYQLVNILRNEPLSFLKLKKVSYLVAALLLPKCFKNK